MDTMRLADPPIIRIFYRHEIDSGCIDTGAINALALLRRSELRLEISSEA